ncbi:RNA-binding protein [Philodulcilactobacillus myokoensis]|uniref:RNA-binding protein n=1 Tax=Philodulcilactobacillus myokoensis TaxID=2929573 RepID=A0A9W6B160_9LACO|nr:YhbY family RNA-binding protein [Philodulcilactobacillus myokoensis]GLB46758.1 RNA-binding protein [Philodulcilactobacillus myokoensis]
MNLRGKQKRYLRAQANRMKPIFSIGKNGLNQQWLDEVNGALEKRELIKVNIQQSAGIDVPTARDFIINHSSINVVQTIGKTLLLFKRAQKPTHRHFSNEVEDI